MQARPRGHQNKGLPLRLPGQRRRDQAHRLAQSNTQPALLGAQGAKLLFIGSRHHHGMKRTQGSARQRGDQHVWPRGLCLGAVCDRLEHIRQPALETRAIHPRDAVRLRQPRSAELSRDARFIVCQRIHAQGLPQQGPGRIGLQRVVSAALQQRGPQGLQPLLQRGSRRRPQGLQGPHHLPGPRPQHLRFIGHAPVSELPTHPFFAWLACLSLGQDRPGSDQPLPATPTLQHPDGQVLIRRKQIGWVMRLNPTRLQPVQQLIGGRPWVRRRKQARAGRSRSGGRQKPARLVCNAEPGAFQQRPHMTDHAAVQGQHADGRSPLWASRCTNKDPGGGLPGLVQHVCTGADRHAHRLRVGLCRLGICRPPAHRHPRCPGNTLGRKHERPLAAGQHSAPHRNRHPSRRSFCVHGVHGQAALSARCGPLQRPRQQQPFAPAWALPHVQLQGATP